MSERERVGAGEEMIEAVRLVVADRERNLLHPERAGRAADGRRSRRRFRQVRSRHATA
jgi:hypothetical protein